MDLHSRIPKQKDYLYANVKADKVDETLYNKIFSCLDSNVRTKFQRVSDQEAAAFMHKFHSNAESLLSETQRKFYQKNKYNRWAEAA